MKWTDFRAWFGFGKATDTHFCFCTLAIHAPYRARARLLCADLAPLPMIILTDEPRDFADLPVRAIRHKPTGPMAKDYLERLPDTTGNRGAAAYHDKRFALQAALRRFNTAIFLDADTRIAAVPQSMSFAPGLAVTPVLRRSVAEHLETIGTWRLPVFQDLSRELTGETEALKAARWCQEACFAVTKDGREDRFFSAWGKAAEFMQQRNVFSGEGGVIGLAAAYAGWAVDYDSIVPLAAQTQHEAGGPKRG